MAKRSSALQVDDQVLHSQSEGDVLAKHREDSVGMVHEPGNPREIVVNGRDIGGFNRDITTHARTAKLQSEPSLMVQVPFQHLHQFNP